MNFYNYIADNSLSYLIDRDLQFKKILPRRAKEFMEAVVDIASNNKSVYIAADFDTDGYMSALQIKIMFDAIGIKNYTISRHDVKRHVLSKQLLTNIIASGKYDYFFILDSSSADKALIEVLSNSKIKTVVVDHHMSSITTSPSNVVIINPKIDALLSPSKHSPLESLSAGAIVTLLVDATMLINFKHLYRRLHNRHWLYGYITLYSDCICFDKYSYAFAKYVREMNWSSGDFPEFLSIFTNKYFNLSRSFVSFSLVPRLNSLFRSEDNACLNSLFFDDFDKFSSNYSYEYIDNVYKQSKVFVQKLVTDAKCIEYDNCVYSVISNKNKSQNYTGLVAMNIGNKYGKTAITVVNTGTSILSGSVRDLYNRDVRTVFADYCYAKGHPSAFGIKLNSNLISDIIPEVNNCLCKLAIEKNDIIIDIQEALIQNRTKPLFEDMANYNEFAFGDKPRAFISLTLTADMNIVKKYEHYWTVDYMGLTIKGFCSSEAVVGNTVYICPSVSDCSYSLCVSGFDKLNDDVLVIAS